MTFSSKFCPVSFMSFSQCLSLMEEPFNFSIKGTESLKSLITFDSFSNTYSHSLSSLNFFSKAFLYLSNFCTPDFKISGSSFDQSICDQSEMFYLMTAYCSYSSCNLELTDMISWSYGNFDNGRLNSFSAKINSYFRASKSKDFFLYISSCSKPLSKDYFIFKINHLLKNSYYCIRSCRTRCNIFIIYFFNLGLELLNIVFRYFSKMLFNIHQLIVFLLCFQNQLYVQK